MATKFILWLFHWDDELDCGTLAGNTKASEDYVESTLEKIEEVLDSHLSDRDTDSGSETNAEHPAIRAMDILTPALSVPSITTELLESTRVKMAMLAA